MGISVTAEKCTGCRICELSCSYTKLQSFNPKDACIKVVDLDYWGFSNPVLCIQCPKPACVEACPTRALSQTKQGIILLDAEKCDGCGDCVPSCPIGAINWRDEQGLPMICDLCGGKPVCVEWCPFDTLVFNGTDNEKIKSAVKKELNYSIARGNRSFGNSRVNKVKGRGKIELKHAIGKGKRSLSKLNVPDEVLDWYQKFI